MLARLLLICILVVSIIPFIPISEAHLPHLTHYNGGSQLSGDYLIYLGTDPEYIRPGDQANLLISIQDTNGNDLHAVKAEVKILKDDELVKDFPLFVYTTGDFKLAHTFSEAGTYQVEIDLYGSKELPYSGGAATHAAPFNVFVSQWYGQLFNSVITVAIIAPLAVLGLALGLRKPLTKYKRTSDKPALFQYIAVLAAIAAGTLHVILFPDHSSESLYYGIFFLVAGSSQLSYGVLYMMYRRKSLNYIGLFGTIGIIGLYIYSITFPPPFHPTPLPEQAEVIGFAVKAIESLMLISIIYVIINERKHHHLRASTDQIFEKR